MSHIFSCGRMFSACMISHTILPGFRELISTRPHANRGDENDGNKKDLMAD
jgi:hypothetical protein